MKPMQPMAPMKPMQPMAPIVFDAEPAESPFDGEAYTSALELSRLTRRMLRLGLFRLTWTRSFPQVARSEAGGYEPAAIGAGGERVHPARELRRLIDRQTRQGCAVDDRLKGQLAEAAAEARTRLEAVPLSLMWTGCLALLLDAACPVFGLLLALTSRGGPGNPSGGTITLVVLTATSGSFGVYASIPALLMLAQHLKLKRFGREVVEEIEPLATGRPAEPVVAWPAGGTRRAFWAVVAVAVLLFTASLTGIIVVANLR